MTRRKELMHIIDRFTRDKVSRFVWGLLTLACLVMFLVGRTGESRAYTSALDDAKARALVYTNDVRAPAVAARPDSPVLGFVYREIYPSVQAQIFTDPTVARVRLWSTDGTLLFSTDSHERAGQVQVTDDPGVQAAASGGTFSQTVRLPFTFATTGDPGVETDLLQVYSPLRVPDRIAPAAVVQIDFLLESLRAGAADPWRTLQAVFGVLFFVCLAMTVLSFRASTHAVGAGVASLERAVGPREEAEEGEPQGAPAPGPIREMRRATERVGVLEAERTQILDELEASREQLRQAEEAYRFLEGRLRQSQVALDRREAPEPGPADARAAELEEALRKSEAELALLLAGTAEAESSEVQAELAMAEERRIAAESRAQQVERRVAELESHLAETRDQFEGRVAEMETELQSAREELDIPEPETDAPPMADPAASAPEPEAPTPEATAGLAHLEARLQEAERRADEAEGQLADLSPEASDLRTRLARTAARKHLGAGTTGNGSDEQGADERPSDEHPGK